MRGVARNDKWGDLMRAALAGDARAYRSLLDELAGALRVGVRAALARSGRGNADIEDVVQETLLAVHLKKGNWDPTRPFAPWVNAVARYKVTDALRRHGLRAHLALDDLLEAVPAPCEETKAADDAERLVGRLSEREQRIVRAAFDGRSAADTGAELGMSEGAVRVALHRALKRLAELYRSEAT